MSNRRGRPRLRPYEPHVARQIRPDGMYRMSIGWARGTAEVEEAKQTTHDELIEKMGDTRTGGVQWRIAKGHDAFDLLDLLAKDANQDGPAIEECRKLLSRYAGFIILALAEGRPTPAET